MKFGKALKKVGLWVPVPMGNKNKTFSGGTEGNGGNGGNGDGGMRKWGSPPDKVWWPPVLLIFYLSI